MLKILPSGDIELTRGDSAWFEVDINNEETGEKYEIKTSDKLTMTIRKSVFDEEIILSKTVVATNIIELKPIDTSNLEFGKYKYDVQLTTGSGDVFTVIAPSNFNLLYEVTK